MFLKINLFLNSLLYFLSVNNQVLSLEILYSNVTLNDISNQIHRSGSKQWSCDRNSDCPGLNQRCLYGNCVCKVNYVKTSSSGCSWFSCNSVPSICSYSNTQDNNRQCRHSDGSCVCKSGYKSNIYSQFCEPACTWNNDCGINEFCYKGQCLCYSGYYRVRKTCQSMQCNQDTDCYYSLQDYNTYCSFGSCYCNNGYYLDSSTQLCTKKLKSAWLWAWVFFFLPVAIIIIVVYYIRKRRHHHHHSDVHVYRY